MNNEEIKETNTESENNINEDTDNNPNNIPQNQTNSGGLEEVAKNLNENINLKLNGVMDLVRQQLIAIADELHQRVDNINTTIEGKKDELKKDTNNRLEIFK